MGRTYNMYDDCGDRKSKKKEENKLVIQSIRIMMMVDG